MKRANKCLAKDTELKVWKKSILKVQNNKPVRLFSLESCREKSMYITTTNIRLSTTTDLTLETGHFTRITNLANNQDTDLEINLTIM